MNRAPIALLLLSAACAPTGGFPWTWEEVGEAAREAATAPEFLLPAAAAGVLQIDEWDQEVSQWARAHTPIYDSQDSANRASDVLAYTSLALPVVLAAVTPTGPGGEYLLENTPLEFGLGAAAMGATTLTVSRLKKEVDRKRPRGRTDGSFPSGHAAASGAASELARRYVDYYPLQPWARTAAKAPLHVLPLATAWARVEAGDHFPSDGMAGVAIGAFFAGFANGLLDRAGIDGVGVEFEALPEGSAFGFGLER